MSLDLKKLEKEIEEQLNKETRFSLTKWITKEYWKLYGIKSLFKIIKMYLVLLIPSKIYKKIIGNK